MGRNATYSDEKIIETGISLSEISGRQATAAEIHKSLGGRGRYARVCDIWQAHLDEAEEETTPDVPLPLDIDGKVSELCATVQQMAESIARNLIKQKDEELQRMLALKDRDFSVAMAAAEEKLARLKEDNIYLRECLDRFEDEREANERAAPELVPAGSQAPVPAVVAPAEVHSLPHQSS